MNSFIDTVDALSPDVCDAGLWRSALSHRRCICWSYNVWMTIAGHQRDEAPMGDMTYAMRPTTG